MCCLLCHVKLIINSTGRVILFNWSLIFMAYAMKKKSTFTVNNLNQGNFFNGMRCDKTNTMAFILMFAVIFSLYSMTRKNPKQTNKQILFAHHIGWTQTSRTHETETATKILKKKTASATTKHTDNQTNKTQRMCQSKHIHQIIMSNGICLLLVLMAQHQLREKKKKKKKKKKEPLRGSQLGSLCP